MKVSRTLVTVADLRLALNAMDPALKLRTALPPYTGVVLVEDGGFLEVRAPRDEPKAVR